MSYYNTGDIIGKPIKWITKYLACKFCGDTSHEDELQVTEGKCPNCNNKSFDEVPEDHGTIEVK